VCGRSCTTDAECGAGFRCKPTTTSGDMQCVSDTACHNGATPCKTAAECTGSACRAGVCVGPADPSDAGTGDAGAEAGDGGANAVPPLAPGGGGCSCSVGPSSSPVGAALALTSLCAAVALAHRRRRPRAGAP
jgi:MYXO-CTERM domain-containing protein